jgi:hypothetical protein
MADKFIGGCLCRQVRFSCDDPVVDLVLCHCRDCRYITGGEANAAALVSAKSFHSVGELKGYTSLGGSGHNITRSFCSVCGTPILTSFSGRPEVFALKAGTLDDQQSLRVSAKIWTGSAPPWHHVEPDVPEFREGFPRKLD